MFHGNTRPTSANEIVDYDVVITTYATLVADGKKKGLLQEVYSYRVVLNEGRYALDLELRKCSPNLSHSTLDTKPKVNSVQVLREPELNTPVVSYRDAHPKLH